MSTSTPLRVRVQEITLSDGSKVYNVIVCEAGFSSRDIEIPAMSEAHANKLAAGIAKLARRHACIDVRED